MNNLERKGINEGMPAGETRETWRQRAPFSVAQEEKERFFSQELERLTEHHRRSCQAYDDICNGLGLQDVNAAEGVIGEGPAVTGEIGPYLPVAVFKDLQLCSVTEEEVIRQVTSSGTTGQQVSRIYLDAATSELQRWALCAITGDFIGTKRMPMLIIDSPDVLRDRSKFTARGAGILGFSTMSSRRYYALDENMQLDRDSIEAFLEAAQKVGASFAFGFTFMIWAYFYQALEQAGETIDLQGCTLIHGGGWKKLQAQRVSDDEFREKLRQRCGFGEICDYYGMAEQTGSIFMQCSEGHLHASIFSDIEILRPDDFSLCDQGEWGLIALRSWLPTSYPGHLLLTEDWGRILGTDDCPCGRKGKYFEIRGRIPKAEIRGCSDTFGGPAAAGAAGAGGASESVDAPVAEARQASNTAEPTAEEAAGDTGAAAERSVDRQPAAPSLDAAADGDLELLAGSWPPEGETMATFDPLVCRFLDDLSQLFMKDPTYRQFPDIYALGFWLRKAHIRQLQRRQAEAAENPLGAAQAAGVGGGLAPHADTEEGAVPGMTGSARTGRGLTLHIAPSNMPTMFAYSWITSLLAGNPGVVRLSGKDSPISDRILAGIRRVMDKPDYEILQNRNAFVRFPRGHAALHAVSATAAARMIWGGDSTVAQISAIPGRPDAVDIGFPDKYSIALLDAQAIGAMDEEQLRMQAHLFCRDTYGVDQNACSSPRSVFWIADPGRLDAIKRRWWDAVAEEAKRYPLEPWMATEKYRQLCVNLASLPQLRRMPAPVQTWDNRLYVVPCGQADQWDAALPEAKLGTFYEFDLTEIAELYPLLTQKLQTVVCVGCEPADFLEKVRAAGCDGVDRAVYAGEALEFDTIWDRKDLIFLLSRIQ